MLPADGNHLFVEVHHGHALDGAVPQRLPQCGPFATARDEDCPWPTVRQHGGLHQRLMIDELVGLAGLDLPVEHKADTEAAGADHLDALIGAASGVEVLVDPVHHRQVGRQRIVEPGVLNGRRLVHAVAPCTGLA